MELRRPQDSPTPPHWEGGKNIEATSMSSFVYETDLLSSQVRFSRNGDDLVMLDTTTNNPVVFSGYFSDPGEIQDIHLSLTEGIILRRPEVDATLANGGVVPGGITLYDFGTLMGTSYMDTLLAADGGAVLR